MREIQPDGLGGERFGMRRKRFQKRAVHLQGSRTTGGDADGFPKPVRSPELRALMIELEQLCERFAYLGSYSEVI